MNPEELVKIYLEIKKLNERIGFLTGRIEELEKRNDQLRDSLRKVYEFPEDPDLCENCPCDLCAGPA